MKSEIFITLLAVVSIGAGSALADVVEFGYKSSAGLVSDPSVTSHTDWSQGYYTNYVTGAESTGNGSFVNAQSGAMLTSYSLNPVQTLVLTATSVTGGDATLSATNTDLGINGNGDEKINVGEKVVFSFNQDVYLKMINFQALTRADKVQVSWGSTVTNVHADMTFDPGQFLSTGSTLSIEGITGGTGTTSFLIRGLVVETIPEPQTIGLMISMSAGLVFIRRQFLI